MIHEMGVDADTLDALYKTLPISKPKIKDILRYNVVTPKQAATLFDTTVNGIYAKVRSGKLTQIDMFPSWEDEATPKFRVFIIRDEKFADQLEQSLI